jgi:hypothetical protein
MHSLHKVHEINVFCGDYVCPLVHMLHSTVTPCILLEVVYIIHQVYFILLHIGPTYNLLYMNLKFNFMNFPKQLVIKLSC